MGKSFDNWTELAAHLPTISSRHLDVSITPTGHHLIRFELRRQDQGFGVFFIHNARGTKSSWVFVGVRLAMVHAFDLEALMRVVVEAPIGALSLAGDYLCVGHNLPVRGLRVVDLDATIDTLCDLAARCLAAAEPPKGDAFAYLVD